MNRNNKKVNSASWIQVISATSISWKNTISGEETPRHFWGLWFNLKKTRSISLSVRPAKSVPLGKYCLIKQLAFSLVPSSQAACGWAKYTLASRACAIAICLANSLPLSQVIVKVWSTKGSSRSIIACFTVLELLLAFSDICWCNLSHLSCLIFLVQFGAVLMRHRGHNGHNGRFSHSLVYCMGKAPLK